MSLCLSTVKIEGVKREAECCCCFSKEDLFSMLEPYNFGENVEIYSTMIADCFQIESSSYIEEYDRNRYLICKNCVFRLREAIMLRCQIQKAYDRLQAECSMKRDDQDDISNECSNLIDTKDHILKDEISEHDNTEDVMNVNSRVPLSKENLSELKHVKIVLEKMDNETMENVSIISVYGGSNAKSQRSKIYFCNICNKLFSNLHAIQEHRRSHLPSKIFICDYCKRGITRKSSLRAHILLHMGIKKIKCDLCKKYFVCKRSLSFHNRRCHSVKLSCTCNICGKTLSKRSFNLHVLSHSGILNEKCEICGKTFTRKDSFRNHMRAHFDTNKVTCKYCNKTFRNNYQLSRHEKIHLDIRDFFCDYCKKEFRYKNSLKVHILSQHHHRYGQPAE